MNTGVNTGEGRRRGGHSAAAGRTGVALSLVVAPADHLERIGAVDRVRDAADRRRQVLALTHAGRGPLNDCTVLAHRLDEELTGSLTAPDQETLRRVPGVLGAEAGLPTDD